MEIVRVKFGGFSNVESVELDFNKINTLVALNNYGKSNVIKGIQFGIDFIKNQSKTKAKMMAFKPFIPYNENIDNKPFRFEIEINAINESSNYSIIYSYSFDWIKNDKERGKRILEESLKVKNLVEDLKYSTFLKRGLNKAAYLPSKTGRCDREIKIEKDELVINKLESFDELFYYSIIKTINDLNVASVDTLQNPDDLYKKNRIHNNENLIVKNDYSLSMNEAANSAYFIYGLSKKKPQYFELFKDAVMTLLPSLEDFEPVEIDLKETISFKNEEAKIKLPLDFPEKIYDIRVKERNNNQQTSITSLSSGSQKIFYVVSVAIAAEINKMPLITYEELENSIHPGLLQKLLIILDNLLENSKILLSSHSPYLIQYLDFSNIKIGTPNEKGLAIFKQLRKSKFKKLLLLAEDENISVGDLIFEKMIECQSSDDDFFNEMCN
ncbi:MAG: ATP-binding protein [Bacteroidales bacterium]|jgi:hypothetical protein|nr:ATP-binding protein [Bacteroidales bacterium]MCK9499052.1 ATP-binding protein [Bacteroidales bacterium]MDY0315354.1 ATP-binding protein [Bacteroidales bacterium]NLB86783.1 ATP-binding protein [Bacteroidales bacterium]